MNGWTGGEDLDLENVSDPFEVLPRGLYYGTFAKAEPTQTSSGNKGVECHVLVDQAYGGPEGGISPKKRIYETVVLTPKARHRVVQICEALGISKENRGSKFEQAEALAKDILEAGEAGVWMILKEDEYNGKIKNKVERFVKADDVPAVAKQLENQAARRAAQG